jgi:hypothetical protein
MTEPTDRPSQRSSLLTQVAETEIAQTETAQSKVSRHSRHRRLLDRFTSVFPLASERARRERTVGLSRNPSDQEGPGVAMVNKIYIPVWSFSDNHLVYAYDDSDTLNHPRVRKVLEDGVEICHSEACRDNHSLAEKRMATLLYKANSEFAAESTKRSRKVEPSDNSRIEMQLIPHLDLDSLDEEDYVRHRRTRRNPFGPLMLKPEVEAELESSAFELEEQMKDSQARLRG